MFISIDNIVIFLLQLLVLFVLYKFPIQARLKLILFMIILFEYTTVFLVFGNKLNYGLSFISVSATLLLIKKISDNIDLSSLLIVKPNIKSNSSRDKVVGITIILLTLISEYYFFDSNLSFLGQLSLFVGIVWYFRDRIIAYDNFLGDFSFVFINMCFLSLFLPFIFYKFNILLFGNPEYFISEDKLIYWSLTVPLGNVLNFIGDWSYYDSNYKDTIFFYDNTSNRVSAVSISKGCTGIYSVITFVCALLSFNFLKFKKNSLIFVNIAFFGLFIAYSANILRMVLIIYIGHIYGSEKLLFAHANLGWLIFLIWSTIFWYFYDRYFLLEASIDT